jgi:hypothetical protein
MSSRGFEFCFNLDGSSNTPLIRDLTLGVAAAHTEGDVMLIQSDGYADQETGDIDEITGIMQETIAAADITAGTTKGKVAIVTSNQVWKCSMDATTATTAIVGYTKTLDLADTNTIDADDITNGSMALWDTDTDDDGNVLAYVVFTDTTWGNT